MRKKLLEVSRGTDNPASRGENSLVPQLLLQTRRKKKKKIMEEIKKKDFPYLPSIEAGTGARDVD